MFVQLILVVMTAPGIVPYKILVTPYSSGFNSRLLNMQKMADVIAQDGHDVYVLMNTKIKENWICKSAKMLEFHTTDSVEEIGSLHSKPKAIFDMFGFLDDFVKLEASYVRAMARDDKTLQTIKGLKFDLVVADFNSITAVLLVAHLNITTIWYQNYFMPTDPKVFYPILPSIVCTMPGITCKAHSMEFKERFINFITNLVFINVLQPVMQGKFEKVAEDENFALQTPMSQVTENKIVIVNANHILDTPVPSMPHIFPISGLFHQKPSPLTKQFLDIIISSPHGVILLSFGTLMSELEPEKAELFARVFGLFPHAVIWRYKGPPPKSLKPNTHLVEWFPQNDLLANLAVKAFITHCGISSTFESALHGVPVIALPIVADQSDNAGKLVGRVKMGIQLNYDTLTEEELVESLQEVLSNTMYKVNAQRASSLLNYHMVSPQQQLHHLVNFTIETGGAQHLFHPFAANMSAFVFYSLDVISVILAIVFVISFMSYKIFRMCCRCCCKGVFGAKKVKTS